MTILVDVDACPVVSLVEDAAKARNIPLVLYTDTNHVLWSDYATVRTVSAGADSVDFALISATRSGDLVVTQDYGLAAMALAKSARAIQPGGRIYTPENIDALLDRRAITKEVRRSGSHARLRGPKKRTAADDDRFRRALAELLDDMENE